MSKKRILIIAAHPDDEVLGCGATIARHAQCGNEVHVVILAEGITSRDKRRNRKQRTTDLSALAQAAHMAKDILGATSLNLLDFPDNRMDSLELLDVIKVIERHIDTIRPEIIYTHHAGDLNIDHRIVHQAVATACRPQPDHPVKLLLFFEVPSSTEWQPPASATAFNPNWFVDVTDTLMKKLKAFEAYHTEIRPWPHPRSAQAIEYLARWRGSCVGVDAAEAFVLGRNIIIKGM